MLKIFLELQLLNAGQLHRIVLSVLLPILILLFLELLLFLQFVILILNKQSMVHGHPMGL